MMDHAQQGIESLGRPSDPEVPEKPVRRSFSAAYKQRIVEEADGCSQPGELGLLLRREGLFASLLSTWRRQRDEGYWPAWRRNGVVARPSGKTRRPWRKIGRASWRERV